MEQTIHAVGVRGRSNFIKVKCRWLSLSKTSGDPINRAGMTIETNPHWQRNTEHNRIIDELLYDCLRFNHLSSVHCYGVRTVIFTIPALFPPGKNEIDRKMNQL